MLDIECAQRVEIDMSKTTQEITVEFECTQLPEADDPRFVGLRLGIQEGKEVIQDVPCTQVIAHFRCTIRVVMDNETPDFRGACVQGARADRFIYLCWGERKEGAWLGSRRAKLSLEAIPRALVETAMQTAAPLQVRIRMRDDKGAPVAASLKPTFVEWSVGS